MKTTMKTKAQPAPKTPDELVAMMVEGGLIQAEDAEAWLATIKPSAAISKATKPAAEDALPGKLTPLAVKKLGVGMHRDSRNLYLQVKRTKAGNISRSWIFRTKGADGRDTWLGLGATYDVTPQDARVKARELRNQKREGHDPRAYMEAARAPKIAPKTVTFKEVAAQLISVRKKEWASVKHAAAFEQSLRDYAYPVLGDMDVAAITSADIQRALEPLWETKTTTMDRTRDRIRMVLDRAMERNLRPEGPNPAELKRLDLPDPRKISEEEHMPAVKKDEVKAAYKALCEMPGAGALAMRFQVLTALRAGSVLGATWDQIDEGRRLWIIPKENVKGRKGERRMHRVPLSTEALAVLELAKQHQVEGDPRIFPVGGNAIVRTMNMLRKPDGTMFVDHDGKQATGHGWRSLFRGFAEKEAKAPRWLARMSMAQTPGDEVDAAYADGRDDALELRAPLMQQWANKLTKPPRVEPANKVVPIRRRRA